VGQRSNHSVEVAVAAPCDVSILIRGGCAAYLTIPYLSRMVRYSLWLRSHVIFAPEVAVDGRTTLSCLLTVFLFVRNRRSRPTTTPRHPTRPWLLLRIIFKSRLYCCYLSTFSTLLRLHLRRDDCVCPF
jgi:hypothetical protein